LHLFINVAYDTPVLAGVSLLYGLGVVSPVDGRDPQVCRRCSVLRFDAGRLMEGGHGGKIQFNDTHVSNRRPALFI
jgi:hypothetical protein